MEFYFYIIQMIFMAYNVVKNICLSKKIDLLQKNQINLSQSLSDEIEHIYPHIVSIHEKVQAIPSSLKDEINRCLLPMRDSLEGAKPMKSNNWDSVREAFKGPARIDVNERN